MNVLTLPETPLARMRAEEKEATNLDAKLLHRLRRQQRTNLSRNGSVESADDDPISLVEDSVRQDDVDGRSQSLDDLDLEHGALESREVHEALRHALLSELDDEHEHVGDSLASVGRSRDERDNLGKVLVLVVGERVESLLGERENRLVEALLVLAPNRLVLGGERLLETAVGDGLPAVETIDLRGNNGVSKMLGKNREETNLVESDDERRLALAKQTKRFESLRLESVLIGALRQPSFPQTNEEDAP